MKKSIFLLVVVLFVLNIGVACADEKAYVRIVIPAARVGAPIQPVFWDEVSEQWGTPTGPTAWYLAPDYPQEIYLHRLELGAELPRLMPGDLIFLYEDWGAEPVQLRVTKRPEPINAADVDKILMTGGDLFAIVTCDGSSRRLIIWARVDRGPRLAPVGWGDNLSSIAKLYGVSVGAIVELNYIVDPDRIRAGTWLEIPKR